MKEQNKDELNTLSALSTLNMIVLVMQLIALVWHILLLAKSYSHSH